MPATILLVDDERDILDVLGASLRRAFPEARILAEEDPRKALEVLEREQVDVIVSDHRMPTMEGIELLIQARRRAPGAVRMMMTGYASEELVLRNVNDAHVRNFFPKPAKLADIVAAVRRALDAKGAEVERARALARSVAQASVARLATPHD